MSASSKALAEDSATNCSLAAKSISDHVFSNEESAPECRENGRSGVLILTGEHKGEEGVCLGEGHRAGMGAISPDHSDEVLSLEYEKDFGLLVDCPEIRNLTNKGGALAASEELVPLAVKS